MPNIPSRSWSLLSGLSCLQSLRVENSGPLDSETVQGIFKLSALRSLNLGGVTDVGHAWGIDDSSLSHLLILEAISQLQNLTELSLTEHVDVDNRPWFSNDHVETLRILDKKLTKLSLVGCKIDKTDGFNSLHNLTYLNLSDTPVTDDSLDRLTEMNNLKVLQLANTAISNGGVERVLRNIKNLVDLNVIGCSNVSHTTQSLRELQIGAKGLVFLSSNRVGPRQ